MKYYELNCLISSNLSQEELKTFQEKIENCIQEEGGIFIGTKNPTKRSLLYSIKTKLHPTAETAYFVTLNFNLVPEKLKNIEKKLKSESQILRYLILNKKAPKAVSPLVKEDKSSFPPFAAARVPKIPVAPGPKAERVKKEKVKLEEIEEKLEEILGDV